MTLLAKYKARRAARKAFRKERAEFIKAGRDHTEYVLARCEPSGSPDKPAASVVGKEKV